jgi:hypothetical protein
MSDELIAWLRAGAEDESHAAADLIESQARDIAALRQDITEQIQLAREAMEVAGEYREVIAAVCEGFTLPDAVRKILETALWNPSALKKEKS